MLGRRDIHQLALFERVVDIVLGQLGSTERATTPHSRLRQLGADDIDIGEIYYELGTECDFEPPKELPTNPTIRELMELAQTEGAYQFHG